MHRFYIQPLSFSTLKEGQEHPKCNLQQSIALRIHLILITAFSEFRYDEKFGCLIWECDFENIPNVTSWKDRMMNSIREVVEKFELRLRNHQVKVEITEEEFLANDKTMLKRVKRRVDVIVTGNLKTTNEQFYFKEIMYISPVWVD
ncbi:MAG TPA: GPW/gp25 family protein [Bacteroidia bacterium]|nr:GPW/gp25 family protein [Bacteroidia bacterium]